MRADYLQYLIEIERRHSISAAAQALYLGQTTLSAIVKNVEQELGFPLFFRTHSGVKTTPEGEEAMALIRDISDRFEEIKELGSHTSMLSKPVLVITSPTVNSALALPINRRFLEQEPDGNLEFCVVNGEEVGGMLMRNEGNIGVTYLKAQDVESYRMIAARYQINVEVLAEDQIYLLVAEDHPLARRSQVHFDELEGLRIALLSHYSCDGSIVYPRSLGARNQYTTFPNVRLIKQAVSRQGMAAFLSGYAIRHNEHAENGLLRAVPLLRTRGTNRIYLCLIYRTESNLCYQERLVLGCIKTYFQGLQTPFISGAIQPEPEER